MSDNNRRKPGDDNDNQALNVVVSNHAPISQTSVNTSDMDVVTQLYDSIFTVVRRDHVEIGATRDIRICECLVSLPDHFDSIGNVQVYDVSEVKSDDFVSVKNVKIREERTRKIWDAVLVSIIVFSVISSFLLIWAIGLGKIEITEGTLKTYLIGWCGPIIALIAYRVRILYKPDRKNK